MKNPTLPLVLGLMVALPAAAERIGHSDVTASSTYTESGNYEPSRALDGKQGTSWVEGDNGSGLGSFLTVDLGAEKKVRKIKIWGGDWSSWDYWNRANRPKELELKFSDGTTQIITMKDEKAPQTFELDGGGKKTSSIRVRLKSVYDGTTWLDTAISEIQIFGDGDSVMFGGKARASSEAEEDGDGNYGAMNAVDGLSDSMWCEGSDSDGSDQWLELDFGGARTTGKIHLINGVGSSMSLWMKSNQATSLKLSFSDGSTRDISIERPSYRPQTYEFPTVTASSVKITFPVVKKGKEYNDLCVSEVHFSE